MIITRLPNELINMIFLYLENPEAKMIKDEFKYYLIDHNSLYTKQTGYYLVKSFMSFSEYYFDRRNDPYEYDSYYEKYEKNIYINFPT